LSGIFFNGYIRLNHLPMYHLIKHGAGLLFFGLISVFTSAQEPATPPQGQIHGNFNVLWQQYNEDTLIGATVPPAKTGFNSFGNLTYSYGNFTAGLRFESYLDAVNGYPGRFKKSGIGSRFAQYKTHLIDITVGNFYEQFGSGLTLRTYWEPNLGIDNALDGMRVVLTPYSGITLKGIYGTQRVDFDGRLINTESLVRGGDGDFLLNDIFKSLAEMKTKISLGASFVSKFQVGDVIEKGELVLEVPQNVSVYGGRFQLNRGGISLYGEYVEKINDPSFDNKYIYKNGRSILINTGYSRKGFGINLDAKFVDNMSFRSDRDLSLLDVPINFVPAITKQHTYNLAATLYPYATVLNGESGITAEFLYAFKKETLIGGKYGTNLSINFSAVNGLDTTQYTGNDGLVYGYETNSVLFGPEKFIRDLNIEVKKKFTKKLAATYTFYYLEFNTNVNQVTPEFYGMLYATIHVLDVNYKINPRNSFRAELQNLLTDQDRKDWATVVMEYTFSPHWTFGLIDQYNYGNDKEEDRIHYLFGTVGYNHEGSRLTLGYGKRREGIFCIGGVCRQVPASNGLEITITSTF